ncbi:hypothetical protein F383_37150 [Gossypium arboreum]|uniref:Uncharacterized protein n=1 Tax=Gossypium arboreum TaxID=29729 RepID=A0A0B0M772_GOSAR|nr:hypothetical protein F383_37150 [Gossypium arboreum]
MLSVHIMHSLFNYFCINILD